MKINGRSLTFLGAMLLLTVAGCGGKVGGSTCATPCGVGQVCQAGQCVCSAGLLACDGTCVASNSAHCGSCTVTCTGTDVCNLAVCVSAARYERPPIRVIASSLAVWNLTGMLTRSRPFLVINTQKCRCGPLEKPVLPEWAMGWPAVTDWPTFTNIPPFCK